MKSSFWKLLLCLIVVTTGNVAGQDFSTKHMRASDSLNAERIWLRMEDEMSKYDFEAAFISLDSLDTLYERLQGKESQAHGYLQYKRAFIAMQRRQNHLAISLFKDAIRLRTPVWGARSLPIGIYHHDIGQCEMGNFHEEAALAAYDTAMSIFCAQPDSAHSWRYNLMINLSSLKISFWRYDEAEKVLHEAEKLGIRIYGEDHVELSRVYQNFAMCCIQSGRFKLADQFLLKAERLLTSGGHPWDYMFLSAGFLMNKLEGGGTEGVLREIEKLDSLMLAFPPPHQRFYFLAKYCRAHYHLNRMDYEAALLELDAAVAFADDSITKFGTMHDQLFLSIYIGNEAKAAEYFDQMHKLLQDYQFPPTIMLAGNIILAKYTRFIKRPDLTQKYVGNILAELGYDHSQVPMINQIGTVPTAWLEILMFILEAPDLNPTEFTPEFVARRAFDEFERQERFQLGVDQETMEVPGMDFYSLLIEATLNENFDKSTLHPLDIADRAKYHLLLRMVNRFLSNTDTAYLSQIEKLEKKLISLRLTRHQMIKGSQRSRVDQTDDEIHQIQRSMEDMSKSHAQIPHSDSLRAVQKAQMILANTPETSIVEYYRSDTVLYIFHVRHKLPIDVQRIVIEDDLDSLITVLREGISGYHTTPMEGRTDAVYQQNISRFVSASKTLYDVLIQPISKSLEPNVIIVPDGAMGVLPFEVLLKEIPERPGNFASYPFLIREFTISYAQSIDLLWKSLQSAPGNTPHTLLALAPFSAMEKNPSTEVSQRNESAQEIPQLPHSLLEVVHAAETWNGVYYAGPEASKGRYFISADSFRIVHLSTHASVDDREGNYSFLRLASDSVHRREWEQLYANEVFTKKLQADLLILSACETASGQIQTGEGVLGLTRAFTYAGADCVMSTLWSVDDQLTAHLSKQLHTNLKSGVLKSDALRMAKLSILNGKENSTRHPFYWAGMIATGDISPIHFQ